MTRSLVYFAVLLVFVATAHASAFESYLQQRNALIAREKATGIDGHLHLKHAEEAADAVLARLKAEETVRTAGMFPAQYSFLDMRAVIDASPVLQTIRTMPKGGLLHVHADSLLHPSFWIEKSHLPGCFMYTREGNPNITAYSLHFFQSQPEDASWVPMEQLRKEATNVTAFDHQLFLNMTIVGFRGTDLQVWRKFESGISVLEPVFFYLPIFKEYQLKAMEKLVSDGVYHVETRLTISAQKPALYDLERTYDTAETVQFMKDLLAEFQKSHPYFSMVVIICELRINDADTIASSLKAVYKLREQFPDFVVGFDLVGEEDLGHSLLYFVPSLLRVKDEMAAQGYAPMQYYFHAGETDWQSVGDNLFDAVLLNTTRIGHGFALAKHPELMALVRVLGIAVEVCPISNQLLGLVGDMRDHAAAVMLALDLPVTISSDDPGLWDLGGVSHDWYMAFMSWDVSIAGLKRLALNSIRHSALPAPARASLLHHWEAAWATWVQAVAALDSIDVMRVVA